MQNPIVKALVLICWLFAAHLAFGQTGGASGRLKLLPAVKFAKPSGAAILGAARAGGRIVAVGDRGVVLLSDDDGASFRQAATVPTRATLTAVSFIDDRHGWAVGHWGVILATDDAGENWTLQRHDLSVDQPLFSVLFKDAKNGLAVGLFSLVLETGDGGRHWQPVALPPVSGARTSDLNLFSVFSDGHGGVFIAGEQGLVFHQAAGDRQWEIASTGARGTLWTGVTLDDGTVLVGGLRGSLYRSGDAGKSWTRVDSRTKSSITALAQMADGKVVAVGLDGVMLASDDRGGTFQTRYGKNQRAMTAVAGSARGKPVMFSQAGVTAGE